MQIAIDELTAAGWTQLDTDHWLDPISGNDTTYAQAVLIQSERPRNGRPALTGAMWRQMRREELRLVVDEYGAPMLEQMAGLFGINPLFLPKETTESDLIELVLDREEEQQSA